MWNVAFEQTKLSLKALLPIYCISNTDVYDHRSKPRVFMKQITDLIEPNERGCKGLWIKLFLYRSKKSWSCNANKINLRSHTYSSEIIHSTYILKRTQYVMILRSECGGLKCGTQIKIEKLNAFKGVKRIRSIKYGVWHRYICEWICRSINFVIQGTVDNISHNKVRVAWHQPAVFVDYCSFCNLFTAG